MSERDTKEVQRVKLVGSLWTLRNIVSIVRDLFLIVLIIVMIASAVLISSSVSELSNSLGAFTGMSGNQGGEGQTSFNPDAFLTQFEQDINDEKWNEAKSKVRQAEFLLQQLGSDANLEIVVAQLKSAVDAKDKSKSLQLIQQLRNAI